MGISLINLLVAPLFAAIVGFAVWYFQTRIDTLRREQERLHDDRRKVYASILEPFIKMFVAIKNPKENKNALRQMLSVDHKRTAFEFSLIGADDVVRSFNDFMQYLYSFDPDTQQPDPAKFLSLWGAFLLQIRKDVGPPDTKLTPVDMLRSQIKGIDAVLGDPA